MPLTPCRPERFVIDDQHAYRLTIARHITTRWDCRGKGVSGLIGPGVSGPERSHNDQDCRAVQPSQNHEDEAAPWRLLTFPVVAM
ncbi:hypothetical protein I551_7073 [Mycobacterium ulcerans str. Harvey]|uniref:Uncharacterized protein n=1 Tax=Mycobacterium ulcerans str. Harvey TaxID=1299332 RepID=A0ABP3A9D9_MYCUL|nr:hypothetical protein I551_7073 [Mycobacterium ulcerans str. Harvey]